MIIITALIGSRAYLAPAILGLFILKGKDVKRVFRNNIRVFIRIGLLFIALIVFKQVYRAVRALDFKEIFNLIDEGYIIESILFNGEGRTVFSIYNYEVMNSFRLPLTDTLVRILSIVPFVNNIIPTSYPLRFSRIARNSFFSAGYGVGSNFWAESIAMGGILFMLAITLLWILLLKMAHNRIKLKNFPYIAVVATYCSFYIHRLDWLQVMGCIKSIILIFILMSIWRSLTMRRVSYE